MTTAPTTPPRLHPTAQEAVADLGVDPATVCPPRRWSAGAARTGPTSSRKPRTSRPGSASCASTRTSCRSCCWSAGIVSIWPVEQYSTGLMLVGLTVFNALMGLSQEGKAAAAVSALQEMMIVKARGLRGRRADGAGGRGPRARRHRLGRSRRPHPCRRPAHVASTLEVDESPLTGESLPVPKDSPRSMTRRPPSVTAWTWSS